MELVSQVSYVGHGPLVSQKFRIYSYVYSFLIDVWDMN